jgi:hypothetical protein
VEEKNICPRDFLEKSAYTVDGAALLSNSGMLLSGCSQQASANQAKWPYPYAKLDPDRAAVKAYENCKAKLSCSYGVSAGTLGYLAEEVGYPFTLIPPDIIQGFKGGVPGHSSLCGAIIGAAVTIGLVTDTQTQDKLINDLVAWYKEYEFPQFTPEGEDAMITTVCNSELCLNSVGVWCKAAGIEPLAPEMHERCARLCADVARYTIEKLNETL